MLNNEINNQFNSNNNEINNPFNNNNEINNPFNNNNEINNPFNDNNEINNNEINIKTDAIIEIWIQEIGRKKNTFISGWNLPDIELKKHIKQFKTNNGCNGTLKFYDNIKVIMFQGDQINNIIKYMSNLNININNINIKGVMNCD